MVVYFGFFVVVYSRNPHFLIRQLFRALLDLCVLCWFGGVHGAGAMAFSYLAKLGVFSGFCSQVGLSLVSFV